MLLNMVYRSMINYTLMWLIACLMIISSMSTLYFCRRMSTRCMNHLLTSKPMRSTSVMIMIACTTQKSRLIVRRLRISLATGMRIPGMWIPGMMTVMTTLLYMRLITLDSWRMRFISLSIMFLIKLFKMRIIWCLMNRMMLRTSSLASTVT